RYNAMGSMVWGVTGIIGPLTAAPLIGHHLGALWIVLVVAGSLGASLVALSLHKVLTPEQDGRSDVAEPVLV
ncbi:MAG: MFS transporter, partial [Bryobacteraceae bacterium]